MFKLALVLLGVLAAASAGYLPYYSSYGYSTPYAYSSYYSPYAYSTGYYPSPYSYSSGLGYYGSYLYR